MTSLISRVAANKEATEPIAS